MGMTARVAALARPALYAMSGSLALLAAAWLVAPFAGRAAMGRALRDLRRNEGLTGRIDDVRHAGAGFELSGLFVTTTSGEAVASIAAIRVHPAFAWPPAAIEIERAHVTQRGLETWSRGFAGANASWYRKTAQAIARNYGNLPGARLHVALDDVMIEREGGTFGTQRGIATLSLPDPRRLEATFDGGLVLRGPCGAGDVFSTGSAVVEVKQDSLAVRLVGDLGSFNPAGPPGPSGHVEAARRVPAPGWGAVIGTSATWSGPGELRCHLGW